MPAEVTIFTKSNANSLFHDRIPSTSDSDKIFKEEFENLSPRIADYVLALQPCLLPSREGSRFYVEPTFPQRFARQFGFDQEIPFGGDIKSSTRDRSRTSLVVSPLAAVYRATSPLRHLPSGNPKRSSSLVRLRLVVRVERVERLKGDSSKCSSLRSSRSNFRSPGDRRGVY